MNDTVLRAPLFLTLLAALGLVEWRWPRDRVDPRRWRRWPANLGFGMAGALSLRVLMPWLAVDAALWARHEHVGLSHVLMMPTWLQIALAIVALDLLIYGQYRLMHRVGLWWRMHRVHHSDLALDVSSGVRFHPLEILFPMLLKIAAVLALGAPPVAVLAFEIPLNGFAMSTHANRAIPQRLDAQLRRVVVTPDMHRIHHSVVRDEQDSNFGFHVSWWDRLFGSYRERPAQAQATLPLGLGIFLDAHAQRFDQLLLQPFKGDPSAR